MSGHGFAEALPENEVLSLAADFPTLSHQQWQGLVAKILNRGRPEDRQFSPDAAEARLRTHTVDGLDIDPLYEITGEQPAPIGHPGVMPFVRGSSALRRESAWDVRQFHEDGDRAFTRKAVLADLERGATSIWLQVGADSIAPGDVAEVLTDVMFDLAPVAVSSLDDQNAAAQALIDAWAARGTADDVVSGSLGLDPLGRVAVRGGTPDTSDLVAWARTCRDRFPQVRAGVVDARPYHDAGAGDVEELGAAVATGVEYLRALTDGGLTPQEAFRQLIFRVSAGVDQFLTIAKLRALRRLWARVGEECGVPEADRGAQQHAVTSWRNASRDDPWVNMLRATIECFGAAVGGAESVTVLPFDSVVGLPDDFSRRIARNTQILLAEESSLARVMDPAGGSFYVEHLTDDLAQRGWAFFQEIEAAGGMTQALRSGLITDRLAAVTAERSTRLDNRKLPLTGVSMFPKADEPLLQRRARGTLPPAPAGDIAPLPRHRDAEVFEELRDRSRAFAQSTGAAPTVPLACLGKRRDFGPRETFTSNFLAVAGITAPLVEGDTVEEIAEKIGASGATTAFLCSSPKVYGDLGAPAAAALRAAGVETIYLAGRATELGEGNADAVDGVIYDGVDVVSVLNTILAALGVEKAPATAEGAKA